MASINKSCDLNRENFNNLRVMFEPNVSYRFKKTFDSLQAAVQFSENVLAPADTIDSVIEKEVEISVDSYNQYKVLVNQLLDKLPTHGEDLMVTEERDSYGEVRSKCVVKLQVMLTSQPKMRSNDRYNNHEESLKKLATIDLFKYITDENGHTDCFDYIWTSNVMVRLVGTVARDEVKVAGQPYQPAVKEEVFTEWYPLYEVTTSENFKSVYDKAELCIDPEAQYIPGENRSRYSQVKARRLAEWTVKSLRIYAVATCD